MKRNISRLKSLVNLYQFDLVGNKQSYEHFDELLMEIEEIIYKRLIAQLQFVLRNIL